MPMNCTLQNGEEDRLLLHVALCNFSETNIKKRVRYTDCLHPFTPLQQTPSSMWLTKDRNLRPMVLHYGKCQALADATSGGVLLSGTQAAQGSSLGLLFQG